MSSSPSSFRESSASLKTSLSQTSQSASAFLSRLPSATSSRLISTSASSARLISTSSTSSRLLASSSSSRFMSSPAESKSAGAAADMAPLLLQPLAVAAQTIEDLMDNEQPLAMLLAAKRGLGWNCIRAVLKAKGPPDLLVGALFASCALCDADVGILVKDDPHGAIWCDLLGSDSVVVRAASVSALRTLLPRVGLLSDPSGVFEADADAEAALQETRDWVLQLARKLGDLLLDADDGVSALAFQALEELPGGGAAAAQERLWRRLAAHLTPCAGEVYARIAWMAGSELRSEPATVAALRVGARLLGLLRPRHPLARAAAHPVADLGPWFVQSVLAELTDPGRGGGTADGGGNGGGNGAASVRLSLAAAECLLDLTDGAWGAAGATNAALQSLALLDGVALPGLARAAVREQCVRTLARAAGRTANAQRAKLLARAAAECAVVVPGEEAGFAGRQELLDAVALQLVAGHADGLGRLFKGALGSVWQGRQDEAARQALASAVLQAALGLDRAGETWPDLALSVLEATADVLLWKTERGAAGRSFVLLLDALFQARPEMVQELDAGLIEWKLAQVPEGAVKYRLLHHLERAFASRRDAPSHVGAALVGALAQSLRPGSLGFALVLGALVHLAQNAPAQATAVQRALVQASKLRELSAPERDALVDVRVRLMSAVRLQEPRPALAALALPVRAQDAAGLRVREAQLSGGSDPLYVRAKAVFEPDVRRLVVTFAATNVSKAALQQVAMEVGVLGGLLLDQPHVRALGAVPAGATAQWCLALHVLPDADMAPMALDVGLEFSDAKARLPTWRLPYSLFLTRGAPGLPSSRDGWVDGDAFRDLWARLPSELVCQLRLQARYALAQAAPAFARARSSSVRVALFAATTPAGQALLVVAAQAGAALAVQARGRLDTLAGLNLGALAEEMFVGAKVEWGGAGASSRTWPGGFGAGFAHDAGLSWALPNPDACPADVRPDEHAEKEGVARWARMLKR